jgi:FtsP/CotA-like multicopper oxidase with cupredoxin domain
VRQLRTAQSVLDLSLRFYSKKLGGRSDVERHRRIHSRHSGATAELARVLVDASAAPHRRHAHRGERSIRPGALRTIGQELKMKGKNPEHAVHGHNLEHEDGGMMLPVKVG